MALRLDVTDRDAVFAAVDQTHAHFGSLDVVINNAGYGHFGALEETAEEEARRQIEVNVFGALWVIQATVPILRQQGYGRILMTSSIGGIVTFPSMGVYQASKWALEAMGETLATEVAPFGIKVTLVETGGYATDWGGASASRSQPIQEYDAMRESVAEAFVPVAPGDPLATAAPILELVDAEDPPLRIVFGDYGLPMIRQTYAQRLRTWMD